jgi:hypothetical protein
MPRSFDMSAEYQGNVEDVYRAFTEADYWRARLTDSAVDEAKLESILVGGESGNDGTIEVATLQVMRSANLPGLVTQLHRGDLCVRRVETWSPVTDGIATASLGGSIESAPVNLSGSAVLSPIAEWGGARVQFRVTVQVRIPIIGGKVENLLGAHLAAVVEAEQRFTATWLTNHA